MRTPGPPAPLRVAHLLGPGRSRAPAPRPPGPRQHRLVAPSPAGPRRALPLLGTRRGPTSFWRGWRSYDRGHDRPRHALAEVAIRELQRVTDAALASLSMRRAAARAARSHRRDPRHRHRGVPAARRGRAATWSPRRPGASRRRSSSGVRIPIGRGFAGRIAAERRAVAIEDVDHADILNPILREKGIRSLLGVPLLVEGRVIGVLHVGTLTRAHFTDRRARPAAARRRPRRDRDRARAPARASADIVERCSARCCPRRCPSSRDRAHRPLPARGGRRARRRRLVRRVRARPRPDRARDRRRRRPRRGGRRADGAGAHGAARLRDRGPPARRSGRAAQPAVRAPARPTKLTTLGYFVLDPERAMTAVSAGHLPPIVVVRTGGRGCSTSRATRRSAPSAPAASASTGPIEPGSRVVLVPTARRRCAASRSTPVSSACACCASEEPSARGCARRSRPAPRRRAERRRRRRARRPDLEPLPERLATRWPADADALAGCATCCAAGSPATAPARTRPTTSPSPSRRPRPTPSSTPTRPAPRPSRRRASTGKARSS